MSYISQLIKFGLENSQEPVIKNPVLREALEPRTMAQAPIAEDLEPGALRDEMLKDFDPSQETHEEYLQRINLERPFNMAEGGQLVAPSLDGSRPGYSGKMKWTTKEVQEIYKDLPEDMFVQKRVLPSGRTDYTYRAKINYKGKAYTFKSMTANPKNKKIMAQLVEDKWDELAPNRLSREEYAKLRLKPENRRLRGEDFAKKLNKLGYTTYTGDEWSRSNVYNYDREAPRSSKRLAKDLGFFEKRTVAEAKEIIKTYSGGKHFLRNKNLTDAQITTRASEYIASDKQLQKGGGYSWPRGRQNKRKVWKNIYDSHKQNGRFKLINEKELAGKDGKVNWKKDFNWRKAKFKDTNSGRIYTYDNLQKMVEKHDGGWNKAIKAYDDNARLNQMTFKGKSLNDWFRESMIKQEYEALIEKKVPWKDKAFQKYMVKKKPTYSFTEAHHFKGVKDHPFDTETSFRYANREQGYAQGKYNKAIKSGNAERIAKAKIKYAEDMNRISDDLGGIRFKIDTQSFGKKGSDESIIKAAAKVSEMSNANQIKLFKQLGYRCRKAGGAGESVECYMDDVKKTRADMKSSNVEVRAKALTKQRNAIQFAGKIPEIAKIFRRGIQGVAGTLGLTSGIGYAIEGLIEGGIYDYYRRKGYDHKQAFAETFTPGLIAGRPHGVPWYGGAEKLREQELYGVKEAPTILEDGTIVEGDLIPGKVKPKVKQYMDALEEQDRIYSAIGAKEGARDDYDLAEASADVQDLARSGAYGRVDRTLDPESMASQAYNTAVEKRDALDQRRRTEYLEKVEPRSLEREQKSFDTKRHRDKRYREMKEMFPDYSKEDIDYILKNMYGTSMEKLGEGYTYENIGNWFKDQDKSVYFADNFRMEKAGGGIAGIRRPSALPPKSGPTPYGLPSMLNRVRRI